MYFRNSIVTILLLSVFSAFAQENKPVVESGVLYRHDRSFGVSIHSRGFGLNFRSGKHLTGIRKRILEIDLLTMKHPKEVKTLNQYYDNTKGFVYGKLNALTILRAGIGLQNTLYRKDEPGNIEVGYLLSCGASLGFAKPVFLYVLQESNDPYNPNKVIEKFDPEIHQLDNIYGKAPFGYGVEHTKIHPGVYLKLGMNFDWSTDDDKLRYLEIGALADYYLSPIQLMAFNKSTPLFTTLYATVSFGRKWN